MVDKCPCLKSSCNGANWQCDSVGMDDGASGHCPECGSPLGFDADGTPTVGATYAEVARKAKALDKLQTVAYAQEVCNGDGTAEADCPFVPALNVPDAASPTTWDSCIDLLALADALPEVPQ